MPQVVNRQIAGNQLIPSAPSDAPDAADTETPEEQPEQQPEAGQEQQQNLQVGLQPGEFSPVTYAKPAPRAPTTLPRPPLSFPQLSGGRNIPADIAKVGAYGAAVDRFNAQQMWEAQKAQQAEINRQTALTYKGAHVQIERDPVTGVIAPVRDDEGNILYQPGKKGPVRYDAEGHAVQTQYEEAGPKEVALDQKAPIGNHPDQPNLLYKQNKYSPWDYLGTVQEGLGSSDPETRKAAETAQVENDTKLHAVGVNALGLQLQKTAVGLRNAQSEAAGKQQTLQDLLKQQSALEPQTQATHWTWTGRQPDPAALEAKSKLTQVNAQIDELTKAGYGQPKVVKGRPVMLNGKPVFEDPQDVADAKAAVTNLAQDHKTWSEGKPAAVGDLDTMLQDRKASILAAGGDPESDPVVTAIEAHKKQLGIPTEVDKQTQAEDPLRNDPVMGPLLQERDQLDQEHVSTIQNMQKDFNNRLAPIRGQLQAAQNQVAPLSRQVGALTSRLEDLLGMVPAQYGEDPEVRRAEANRRIAELTDPASKARVQTILNTLEPAAQELQQRQGELDQLDDTHQALMDEANTNIQAREEDFKARHVDVEQRLAAAQAPAQAGAAWEQVQRTLAFPASPEFAHMAAQATSRALAEKKVGEDWESGNVPKGVYHIDPTTKGLTFERGYTAPAMIQAMRDGAVSPDWLRKNLDDARKADDQYRTLMTQAGSDQKLKAFVDTGIKSYLGFQGGAAASAAVSPFDPELAAAGAPVGGWGAIALPALVHGVAFLGGALLTRKAADAFLKSASKYSDLANSIEKSAQLQPGYAGAGEIAGMAPSAVASIAGFTQAAKFIAQKEGIQAAAKFTATRLASGAGAGALFGGVIQPSFDAALHIAGLNPDEVHLPTFKSVFQATIIGSILNGEGLHDTFKRAAMAAATARPETADLVRESIAKAKSQGITPEFRAFFGGIDPEVAGTTPEKVAAFAKSLGMEWQPVPKAEAGPAAPAGPPDIAAVHNEIDNLQMEGRSPEEHAATQNALRGMVKIAQGSPIEGLTTAERAAVTAKGPDGAPRVEVVKGKPVITDAALARVGQIAPITAQIMPGSENEQRQAIISGQPAAAPTPAKGNLPTFSVEVQNAKGETREVQVQAPSEAEAHTQVAQKIPAGQGLIREVTKVAEAPPVRVEPQDFHAAVQQSAAESKGAPLTPQERDKAMVVARVLQPHYERWQKAFDAVAATMAPRETGGVAFTGARQLMISVPDVIRHAEFYRDTPQHAANLMLHEAAHSVTTAAAPAEIIKLWKEAPAALKTAMKQFYKASDTDYALAHEYWSYFLAGRAELAAGRRIRLAGKFLPEQSSRKFIVENRRALARVLRFVRNSEAEMRRAGQSEEFIRQWKQLENLFESKMKEVDGHAQELSKEVAHEAPAGAALPAEHRIRGPPAPGEKAYPERAKVPGEGIGAPRPAPPRVQAPAGAPQPVAGAQLAEPGVAAPQPLPAAAGAQLRPLGAEDRAALATELKVPASAIGATSTVTQNGRTVNVAYVAQEAAAARTSHDLYGRVTPGYDQGLQPRDRSLPQYRKQSQNIANALDFAQAAFFPETRTPATTPDLGAPIMTRGGDTLIGNGREIGIKAAYDQNLPQAAKYKTDFVRNARAFGIDPATVRNMTQPILKRVITDDLAKDELVRFSQESNEPVAMGINAIEMAGRDASRLTPQLLSLFDPNYAIDAARNQQFLQAYQRDVIAGTGANIANLTGSELARRVRAAVFTYAYGADETGRAALERLAGDEGAEGKTITNGMLTVAPIMARLRTDVASGDLHPGMDVAPAITRAAQDISNTLLNRPKGQTVAAALEGYLSQGQLFPGSPMEWEALKFLAANRNKRTAIEEGLSNYAEAVYRLGSPKEGELFGGREIPTPLDLFVRSTSSDAIARKEAHHELATQNLVDHLKAQPVEQAPVERVYAEAERVKPELDRITSEVASRIGGNAITVPLKSRERAAAKVDAEYGGDWSKIKDVARSTIEVRDVAQAFQAVRELESRFGPPKRSLNQVLSTGYRDALFNPVIDGHTVEIQVNIAAIAHAKFSAHTFYERQQAIERGAQAQNRALNAQELRLHDRLTLAQRRIYDAATSDISSTASEGLQAKAPRALSSLSRIGRGGPPSAIQAEPSPPITTPQAPIGAPLSGTSMKPLAFGKRATASSSVIPLGYTPEEGRRAMDILRSQPISADGEKIFKAAVRMPNGEIFTGNNHWDAYESMSPWPEDVYDTGEDGFITDRGRFLTRDEAYKAARVQLSEDIGPNLSTFLAAQQLDLFDNYAGTLPAKAKVSKPVLEETVKKEVPALAENEQAINDLSALANHEKPPTKADQSQELANWVENIIGRGGSIDSARLFKQADQIYGGTQAVGQYTPKDAYDAVEMAINKMIRFNPQLSPQTNQPLNAISALKALLTRIPTQTKRTAETDEYQQFSTVPPLAFVANWVANVNRGDVVLEPSAGVGGLAAFAQNAGAKTVVNELSPRRLALLAKGGHDLVFGENAEQINNVLPHNVRPNVAEMNPPFSATAGRMQGARDTANAIKHIDSALARLQPNGRLVMIVGEGMALDRPAFRAFWDRIQRDYDLRANIQVNGQEYAKYGTTFDNQIVVIDKQKTMTGPPVTGRVERVEDLIPLLGAIRNDRPASIGSLEGERGQVTGGPAARPGAISGGERPRPDVSVRGGLPTTVEPGMAGLAPRGERPVGGRQADLGLGERQGPGEERAVERPGGGARPAPEPYGIAERRAEGALTDAVFDSYQPNITLPGATMPPIEIQESSAMASVDPIRPTYQPAIPPTFYQPQGGAKEGKLSAIAMESVILAGNQHQEMIPLVYTNEERAEHQRLYGQEPPAQVRAGFFIGDGTGVGKGRQVMGIILDNWLQGRKKAIWISQKPPLINDAKRDADNVAQMANKIFDVSKLKLTSPIPHAQGIGFISYATLRSKEKATEPGQKPASRINQLLDWFGRDFDGVIAFDESHNMANNAPMRGVRGTTRPSAQALAGLELQRALPNARVVYLSATGATEVANLGYGERLGLWGPGTPFANKQDFISRVASSGVAGMELVARDMKALGKYVARAISWKGVSYDTLTHALSPEQRTIYDTLAEAWQGVLAEMDKALEVVGAVNRDTGKVTDPNAKRNARGAFWGAHQRFFNQIITSMKMPTALRAAEEHLRQNKSVVMQLVNTNEASQNRGIEALMAEAAENGDEADLEDLDMTPRDVLMQMVQRSFPVNQKEQYTDAQGNIQSRNAVDSEGNPILNSEAVAMREALLDKLGSIRVPDGPLEMVLNHFGKDAVSEITGRTQRVVWGKDKEGNTTRVIERRSNVNVTKEINEFMDGKRRILVFSNAGGTGTSYHADLGVKNQQPRVHMLIQPGWQASKAVQGFGRTHRNNQKQPPHYQLASSDVVGEKRFMSSIARRLDQLGALTKGSRQTASQGFFKSRDNLESPESKAALLWFYRDALSGAIPEVSAARLEKEMGLKMRDNEGQPLADPPPITQFLNRVLSLKLDTQRAVFDAFSDRLDRVIEHAIEAGTLDQGMENLTALQTKAIEDRVIHTDPRSGAQTRYVKLELTQPNERAEFPEAGGRFYRNNQSGKIYLEGRTQNITETSTGRIVDQTQLRGITGKQWVNNNILTDPNRWTPLSKTEARDVWDKEYAATPETANETVHFITGTILPVWDRLNVSDNTMQVRRAQTDDGQRMIGMVIRPKEIPAVLRNFGQDTETATVSPDTAAQKILDDGVTARLSNGWRLKRSRVAGDARIELLGPDISNHAELDTAGVFRERIQFNTRYFVPVDRAADVIGKLTANRPIVELSEKPPDLAAQQIEGDQNASRQSEAANRYGYRGAPPGEALQEQPRTAQDVEEAATRLREYPAQRAAQVQALQGVGRGQPATGLTVVRHGTTTFNGESGQSPDKIRGHTDVPLDANGRRQAVKVGRDLANSGITKIYASDLSRARETAQLMSGQMAGKPAVIPTYGLRPWALGKEIEGKPTAEVMPKIHGLLDRPEQKAGGGGESFNDFKNRFLQTVDQIKRENPNQNVAIVTHFRGMKLLKSIDQAGNLDVAEFKGRDDTIPPGSFTPEQTLRSQALAPTDEATKRFEQWLPLAMGIANRFKNIPGVEPGDVRSRARTALLRAARAYDPARGMPFAPYARQSVANDLRTYYKTQGRGREITTLEEPTEEGRTAKDLLAGPEDVRRDVQLAEGQRIINQAIAELPPRMSTAMTGILNGETLEVIGQNLGGISRQAVSLLATAGMRRLRGKLGEQGIKSVGDLLSQVVKDELSSQTADPIEHLMSLLKEDPMETLRGIPGIGRPDLALGGTPAMAAAHQYHTETATPQTFEAWDKRATDILAERGTAWGNDVVKRWTDGGFLEPAEVRATQRYLISRQSDPMTSDEQKAYDSAAYAYTKIGEALARQMASRRDPFQTPEERNRDFMAKAIVKLSPSQERQLAAIKDDRAKVEALEGMISTRRDQINAALENIAGKGVTIDDILSGGTELRLKGAKIIDNQLSDYSDKERQAIKLAQTGTRTSAEIARESGLTEKQVNDLNDRFISELEDRLMAKTRAGATLENLDPEEVALLAQPAEELGAQAVSDDVARAEARKMIKAMGFVASKDLGKMKVARRKRAARLFVPPPKAGPPTEPPAPGELPYPGGAAPYTGRVLGQPGLPLYQEMMIRKGADLTSPDDVSRLGRLISAAANGNRFDMLYEAWINNILSGPTTHLSYKLALAANMAWEFSVQRGVEALVNLAGKPFGLSDPKSAQLGEFKYILKGLMPGLTRGLSLAKRQFVTESELFRSDVLDQQVEMFAGQASGRMFPPNISEQPFTQFLDVGERNALARAMTGTGRALDGAFGMLGRFNPARGRVVRLPVRVLLWVQGLYHGLGGQLEVAPYAYRIAKSEGLTGQKLENRINELVSTPNSEAWQHAVDFVDRLTFQQAIRTKEQGGNALENLVARFIRTRSGSHLLGTQFPFIQLPYNLFRTGIRKTPLGTVSLVAGLLKAGFFKMKDGKPFFESYPQADLLRHVAEQAIAWVVAAFLWNIGYGDDDDGEKRLLITGALPRRETKKGERELMERAYGGAHQIIIGGRNGLHINYGKYEPIATVLGTVVDSLNQVKHLVRGEQGIGDTLGGMWAYFVSSAEEKTMLRGIDNIDRVMNNPAQEMGRVMRESLMQALVPNLIRQPLRNLDDYVRDWKTAQNAYLATNLGALAQPKIDVYGRPVMKQGNAFSRMFFQAGQRPDVDLTKADQLLLNWNRHHPGETYAPTTPIATYKGPDGKPVQMTPDQQTKFLQAAGKRFSDLLKTQTITQHQIEHPSEDDIKRIKRLHTDAVEQVKTQMFPKAPKLIKPVSSTNVVREAFARAA